MGQQQLLLIILGMIVVGLAVMVGISLFHSSSMDSKRNNVTNECVNLTSMAQRYYVRPVEIGGGGNSFTGWEIPPEMATTENGRYTAAVSSGSVVITGVGNEVVTGSDSVRIKATVFPKDFTIQVIN